MELVKVFMPAILSIATGFIVGDLVRSIEPQKPQNPPAVKVVDFKHVGDITSFYPPGSYPAKLFRYELPNKNGYLAVIITPNNTKYGEITTTYIPREVTWEIK